MRKFFLRFCFALCSFLSFFSSATVPTGDNMFGADPSTRFLTGAPTSYAFGTYGQIPVGMFTGTPNLQIPLYTLETDQLKVPITLSYSSPGVRVDDMSTWTGLSWVCQVGGVITRTIHDEADEWAIDKLYPYQNVDTELDEYERSKYYNRAAEPLVDSEPDVYNYNFMGYSGKFIFKSENGMAITMPYVPLAIRRVKVAHGKFTFEITTPDGTEYSFGGGLATSRVVTQNRTGYGNLPCATSGKLGHYPTGSWGIETGWCLTKVVTRNKEEINFSYGYSSYSYKEYISQTLTKPKPYLGTKCMSELAPVLPVNSTCAFNKRVVEPYLKRIWSSRRPLEVIFTSGGKSGSDYGGQLLQRIEVKYSGDLIEEFNFDYSVESNKRIFLKQIQMSDIRKKYTFSYIDPEKLPPRLSPSQDYWGYYSGRSLNSVTRVPNIPGHAIWGSDGINREPNPFYAQKGMLQTVTYPTGGYDRLEYEGNSEYNASTGLNKIVGGLRVRVNSTYDGLNKKLEKVYYYGKHTSLSQSSGDAGFAPYYSSTSLIEQACPLFGVATYYFYHLNSSSSMPLIRSGGTGIYYRHITVSHGGANFENGGEQYEYIINRDIPGKTISGDGIPSAAWTNSGYSHGELKEILKFRKISGILITVKKELHEYGNVTYPDFIGSYVVNKAYTPIWYPFQSVQCDASNTSSIWKKWMCLADHKHSWNYSIDSKYNGESYCANGDFSDRVFGTNFMQNIILETGICYNHQIGESLEIPYGISHLNIMQYNLYSHLCYLKSKRTTTYDADGNNPIEVFEEYFYENPIHNQLTKKIVSNSNGKVYKTEFTYPLDYEPDLAITGTDVADNASEALQKMLFEENYVIQPVEILEYVNDDIIGGTLYEYKVVNDIICIDKVHKILTNVPIPQASFTKSNVSEVDRGSFKEFKFHYSGDYQVVQIWEDYNSNGNAVQHKNKDGIDISYIWGYQETLPIAKASNASVSDISYTSYEDEAANYSLDSYSGSSCRMVNSAINGWVWSPDQKLIDPDQSRNYLFSCWIKTEELYAGGEVSIDMVRFPGTPGEALINIPAADVTITDTHGEWKYFESAIDLQAAKSLNGISPSEKVGLKAYAVNKDASHYFLLDECRFYPEGAQLETYTYNPPIGLSSIVDERGEVQNFSYDNFNRLEFTRDREKNIVQANDYNYATDDVTSLIPSVVVSHLSTSSAEATVSIDLFNHTTTQHIQKTVVFELDGVSQSVTHSIPPRSSQSFSSVFTIPRSWNDVKHINTSVLGEIKKVFVPLPYDIEIQLHPDGTNLPASADPPPAGGAPVNLNVRCNIIQLGSLNGSTCITFTLKAKTLAGNPVLTGVTECVSVVPGEITTVNAVIGIPEDYPVGTIQFDSYELIIGSESGQEITAENTIKIPSSPVH